jgi:hypothetical protein
MGGTKLIGQSVQPFGCPSNKNEIVAAGRQTACIDAANAAGRLSLVSPEIGDGHDRPVIVQRQSARKLRNLSREP